MTKLSILNLSGVEPKQTPIEFIKYIDGNGNIYSSEAKPNEWENVMLLIPKSTDDCMYDTMLAWDDTTDGEDSCSTIYLGHWNDGVIE